MAQQRKNAFNMGIDVTSQDDSYIDPAEQEIDTSQLSTAQQAFLDARSGRMASGFSSGTGNVGIGYTGQLQGQIADAADIVGAEKDIYSGNLQRTEKIKRAIGTEADTRPDDDFSRIVAAKEQDKRQNIGVNQKGESEGPSTRSYDFDPLEKSLGHGRNLGIKDLASFIGPGATMATIAKGLGMTIAQATKLGITTTMSLPMIARLAAKGIGGAVGDWGERADLAEHFSQEGIDPFGSEALGRTRSAKRAMDLDIDTVVGGPNSKETRDTMGIMGKARNRGFIGNIMAGMKYAPKDPYLAQRAQDDMNASTAKARGMSVAESMNLDEHLGSGFMGYGTSWGAGSGGGLGGDPGGGYDGGGGRGGETEGESDPSGGMGGY